jgi:hypothetical protein
MNEDQNVMASASPYHIIFIDMSDTNKEAIEVDIDKQNDVSLVKYMIYDEESKSFHIMTNMLKKQLGFYLFNVKISDPYNNQFFITWKNNIEIEDVVVAIN